MPNRTTPVVQFPSDLKSPKSPAKDRIGSPLSQSNQSSVIIKLDDHIYSLQVLQEHCHSATPGHPLSENRVYQKFLLDAEHLSELLENVTLDSNSGSKQELFKIKRRACQENLANFIFETQLSSVVNNTAVLADMIRNLEEALTDFRSDLKKNQKAARMSVRASVLLSPGSGVLRELGRIGNTSPSADTRHGSDAKAKKILGESPMSPPPKSAASSVSV